MPCSLPLVSLLYHPRGAGGSGSLWKFDLTLRLLLPTTTWAVLFLCCEIKSAQEEPHEVGFLSEAPIFVTSASLQSVKVLFIKDVDGNGRFCKAITCVLLRYNLKQQCDHIFIYVSGKIVNTKAESTKPYKSKPQTSKTTNAPFPTK